MRHPNQSTCTSPGGSAFAFPSRERVLRPAILAFLFGRSCHFSSLITLDQRTESLRNVNLSPIYSPATLCLRHNSLRSVTPGTPSTSSHHFSYCPSPFTSHTPLPPDSRPWPAAYRCVPASAQQKAARRPAALAGPPLDLLRSLSVGRPCPPRPLPHVTRPRSLLCQPAPALPTIICGRNRGSSKEISLDGHF